MNLTQQELADVGGCTRSFIAQLENNYLKTASHDIIERIARVLKINIYDSAFTGYTYDVPIALIQRISANVFRNKTYTSEYLLRTNMSQLQGRNFDYYIFFYALDLLRKERYQEVVEFIKKRANFHPNIEGYKIQNSFNAIACGMSLIAYCLDLIKTEGAEKIRKDYILKYIEAIGNRLYGVEVVYPYANAFIYLHLSELSRISKRALLQQSYIDNARMIINDFNLIELNKILLMASSMYEFKHGNIDIAINEFNVAMNKMDVEVFLVNYEASKYYTKMKKVIEMNKKNDKKEDHTNE